jgi:hypothetical protein
MSTRRPKGDEGRVDPDSQKTPTIPGETRETSSGRVEPQNHQALVAPEKEKRKIPESANDVRSPGWVLLAAEAKARGFRNALAFRRWCRRRGVRLLKDGKHLWVNPSEVDRAVEALGAAPAEDPSDAERKMALAAVNARISRRLR